MDDKFEQRLARLNRAYSELTGRKFVYFVCPILFRDDNVQLCRGHIVNLAFRGSAKRWTIQRRDVDNFFGHFVEAQFVELQHRRPGLAARSLVDPQLRRAFRPRILRDGQAVDYFVANGPIPDRFTTVQLEGAENVRLALKLAPADVASKPDAEWEIQVAKDVRLAALVSVLKAAHLTLFELFEYHYALSPGGTFIGEILGSFFRENVAREQSDILKSAITHFGPFAASVRPVICEAPELQGTINDGCAQICWLEDGERFRPWAMTVFVRTGDMLHAALMPTFVDQVGAERYSRFLTDGGGDLLTSAGRFKGDRWEVSKSRTVVHWPAVTLD